MEAREKAEKKDSAVQESKEELRETVAEKVSSQPIL